jgi:hypothetical protein
MTGRTGGVRWLGYAARDAARVGVAVAMLSTLLSGCARPANEVPYVSTGSAAPNPAGTLPDEAYVLDVSLEPWVDPDTGYDTAREWSLDGGTWPICIVMSPSQSPQLLVAERDGLLADAFAPFGIAAVVDKIDLPPRTFHALQRSKWPFVYMPLAVFTDYCRSNDNQGGAGGLQYVAIAGSTAGGGYTLLTRDPAIQTVADLADRTVAQVNSNPVPGTLLAAAAAEVGLTLGDGPGQIHLARGAGGDQLNAYDAGEVDAVISLNILKGTLIARGSRPVTDFSDVTYTPNYTVLCVERSVLEERPEVVDAFLEMHYEADGIASAEWDAGMKSLLMASWNSYFESQTDPSAAQRVAADQAAFDAMLGNMYPEDRLDPAFLADCLAFVGENGLWGWDGDVDVRRLSDLGRYDEVLAEQ